MWLSRRSRNETRTEMTAETGLVTLGGASAGVYLSGERRGLPVFSPGGYQWRPAQGQEVLVLKAGADRESPCIIGTRQEGAPEPGEVCLFSENRSSMVRLGQDGEIALTGTVKVNGEELEELVTRIVMDILYP